MMDKLTSHLYVEDDSQGNRNHLKDEQSGQQHRTLHKHTHTQRETQTDTETDKETVLGMFSMVRRRKASTRRGPHGPENVGE